MSGIFGTPRTSLLNSGTLGTSFPGSGSDLCLNCYFKKQGKTCKTDKVLKRVAGHSHVFESGVDIMMIRLVVL